LATGAQACWALVFSGAIDPLDEVRLTIYSDMLREALNGVMAATTNRLVATVARPHAQSPSEPIESSTQDALGHITAAVNGQDAALVVTIGGTQALAVGNTSLSASLNGSAPPDRLVVASSDANGLTTVVVARDQMPFTTFEREIVQAGLAVVQPWIQAALQRSNESERRQRFRPVDALFEQLAADAVHAGQHATVLVISVDASNLRPGLMHAWLRKIRTQTRASDFAGILSDREIVLLLCDTSASQATVVSERMKQLVEQDEGAGEAVHPTIGMTSRSPDSSFGGSLVEAARADILLH